MKSERFNIYDRKTGEKIQIFFVDAASGGCGGNLTTLMAGITCNDAANTPHGKNGTFGGGGGGGAVVNETGGLGGKGGRGMIILEYKSTAI